MIALLAQSVLNRVRSYKRISTVLAALVVIGVVTAGFMVVSGRAAGLGSHLPASLTRIFASRTTAHSTPAPRTINVLSSQPLAPLSDQTWDGGASTNGTGWTTVANWVGDTAFAGSQSLTTNSDIATIPSTGTNQTLGINLNFAGNIFYLGAINFTSANRGIGDSSATAGTLQLNGATVNSVGNVVVRNSGVGTVTLQALQSGTMGVALGNATDNIVNIDSTGGVTISSIISGSSKKLTLGGAGTGTLTLSGVNTYSGDTTIGSGKLALSGTGSIANSPNIVIAGGATFDVTGLTTALTLASGQALKASGTVSTGTITVSATKGLTTAATSPLQFTAFSGSTPPLTLSGAGTLALQTGNPVTVTVSNGGTPLAAGDYKLIAKGTGTVTGTPTSVTVNGNGIVSGGAASLVLTGAELFLHVAAPDMTFNASGSLTAGTYNDITINSPAVVTMTGNVVVNGCVNLNSGGTLNMGANTFTGAGCFSVNSGSTLGIGSAAGITTGATGNVQVGGTRTFNPGANYVYNGTGDQAVGNALPVTVANLTINNTGSPGTVTGNPGQAVTGLLSVADGVYVSASDYNDVDIAAAGTLSLSGDITVSGNWTNHDGTFTPNGFRVTFDGAGTQTINRPAGETFATVSINKASGTAQFLGAVHINGTTGNVLELLNGTLGLNGGSLGLDGTGGNVLVSGGVRTITAGSTSGVAFGGTKTVTATAGGTLVFDTNINVNLAAAVNFGASLSTINGQLIINGIGSVTNNAPTYGAGSILEYTNLGSVTRGAEWTATTASIFPSPGYPDNVTVDTNTTLQVGRSGGTTTNWAINGSLTAGPTGTLTLAGSFPMTVPVTVKGGVNISTGTLVLSNAPGGDLNVGGNFANTGTFTPNGRGVTFNGVGNTQTISGNNAFFDLTINHTGAGSVTAAGSTLAVNGLLRVQSGTFTSASDYTNVQIDIAGTLALSGAITVSGNWTNNGTFTPNGFGVTLDGATGQTLAGTTSFFNLTKSVAAAQTLNFAAGSTTTVSNSLTLNGAAGNLLSLRSTTPGSQWNLSAPATQSVSYVDVQDSNASGGVTVAQTNSVDSGNNVNWAFAAPCVPPSTVYVDDNFVNPVIGQDPDAGGPATNFGCDSFATIQGGIDGVTAGGTVNVAAGTYAENVLVNKSCSVLGPNAAVNPNTGSRVPEAIVLPAVTAVEPATTGAVFRVGSGSGHVNATINGFTIDGHNLALGGGRTLNGVSVNTGAGIVNSTGSFDSNPGAYDTTMIVQNNIIQNLERYGVLVDNQPTRPAVTGNDVSFNKIDNLPSGNNFGGGRGRGIAFEENAYGSATYNVMTRVNVGWQDDNYDQASPGAGTLIDHNTIHTYHRGIFHNLQYSAATDITISNNDLFVETVGAFPATTTNFGLELASLQTGVGATVTGNNSTGNVYGILLWNLPTTANIVVTGGTLTNNGIGVFATSDDPQFGAGAASHAAISGVTITGATTAGIGIQDNPAVAATVLSIGGSTSVSGGTNGLVVVGSGASIGGNTLNSISFNGQSGSYIRLLTGAMDNQEINATGVSFDGLTGATATLAQNYAIEDKLVHAIDDGSLGFLRVKAGAVFVTPNSFTSPATTTPSIGRGTDAAVANDTVNVAAGTYTDNAIITKSLTLTGAGAATTTMIPATSNPNCGGGGGGSLCAGGSNLILVQADNVTISGLTLDGDNPALAGGFSVGGANVDARNGIITNHPLGTFNNLEVHHTTVKNIFLRGIYASSGGTFNFHDNTVQNVQADPGSIGMFNFLGAGAYTNNNVSACNDGISSNHSRGTTYTGNTVTTSASGIHTDNAGDSGGTFDTISNNTVTNSQAFGYGIWVFVPYKTVRVENNTVTNVDVGMASAGDSGVTTATRPQAAGDGHTSGRRAPKSANVTEPGTAIQGRVDKARRSQNAPTSAAFAATFTGNTIDGQNKAGSTGVYFTTSQFGFGSASPKVEFKSNTVKNNVDGFYLEAEDTFTLETAISFNRIIANTNSQATQSSGGSLNGTLIGGMENNWWGCNAGPNNAGCGAVVGAGIDFNPWLVLTTSASPNPIGPGGTSTVTADIKHNSAALVPSLTDFIPQVGVSFTATQGTIAPPSGTITSGQATALFTSTSTSSGTGCSAVDNSGVICTNIVVALPSFSIDDVTHLEGSPSGTTSYVFTVTKTGATTFASSVNFSTVDGTATLANNDYQTNSGTLNFGPTDTTMTATVLVNQDTIVESDEAFTVHLDTPVSATISDADGTGTITNDDVCGPQAVVYVDDNFANPVLGQDPDGGGPATNFGCDSFATIQGGINGVTTGGTVIVAAGTYVENPTVTRAMTIKGAQFGVDARTRVASESIVRTNGNQLAVFAVTGTANVTIDGFTIDGDDPGVAGAALFSGDESNVQYGVRPTGAGGNLNVSNNIIKKVFIGLRGDVASQGNVVNQNLFDSIGNFDFGYAVSIRNNFYANVTNNKMTRSWTGIHINNHNGAGGPASFNITGNEIHSYAGGILYWLQFNGATGATISNNQLTAEATAVANNFGILVVSNQNAVSSTYTNNTISGHNYGIGLFNVPTTSTITLGATNSITGATLAGVFLTDNLNFNPVGTTNFLAGGPGAPSTVNVTGMSITGTAGSGLKVEGGTNAQNIVATSATITGFPTGITLQSANAGMTAHFNRIIATTTAIDNANNVTANLENNWWGCNAGPGNAGCGAVTGTGADFDPWIVLGVSATPGSIPPLGNSNIAADMTKNSAGATPVGTLPDMPIAWSATNGTMAPPTGTVTAGAASSTFTSTSSSSGTGCGTVDNQLTCANVTVVQPSFAIDDVTHNEGNGGPGTTSYTFTITKTGAGAASVDYNTVDGTATSPSDFTAITTTTVSFLSADTTKQFTVLVNGDTAFEANEAFTVHLSNAVGATISDADGTGTITNDDACGAFATVYVDDNFANPVLGQDPDGAGPATIFGCDSFATIQEGINAVTTGGTVIVNAGNYPQAAGISLNKSIVLQGPNSAISPNGGARVAEAIITGPADPVLRISLPGNPVTIEGFKFDSAGVVDAYDPALNITIRKNIYANGISTGAFYFLNAPTQLTLDDNHLTNAVQPDNDTVFVAGNWNGTTGTVATITNNVIENTPSDSASGMNLSNVSGTISGNQFLKLRYYAILLANNSSSMTISGNLFDGIVNPSGPAVPSYGAGIRFYTPAFTGLVSITGNTFQNSYNGVGVRGVPQDPGANITGMNIHVNFNRFINNNFGISDGAAGTLDAENNWWGCNYGPGTGGGGCSATPNGVSTTGTAVIDTDPWIVLGTSASPNPTSPGGNSTVTADMTHNSNALAPAGGPVPLIPVSFSATNGTMAPPTGTITAGQASSIFTSSGLTAGTGCSMVDNQNVCTNINIALPSFSIDDVTHLEGNGGPGTTLYTFTITRTGATAFSTNLDYATVDGTAVSTGGTPDFTAIPTTNVVFLPTDTTKQVTVLVNGDTTVESTEAFTVHLSNVSAGATISDADGTGTITNDDACAVFTTVYVDDDWVGTAPGTDPDAGGPATTFGCDSFATIQEAVNAVTAGGTVIVRAGTYPEAVTISKALTLNGAQAGQNANTRFAAFTGGPANPKANPAVESIITAAVTAPASAANDTLHVMANNVTIDGFVVDGNNAALNQTGATVVGGINTDSRRAIQTENAAGTAFPANNVTVRNNVIQNFSQRGVELINGANSGTAPATTGSVITLNRIRNFGLDGIVLAFNAHADITFNTVDTNDYPTEAGIWVQDFLNTGTPYAINITNNTVTVGQDNFGGIWTNLAYLPTININNNTINAAGSVVSGSDFTYGIYVTSLRPGSNASLSGNIVGASGGTFDRGIALWNLGTGQTTTVTGGTVGRSVKGVSLHDNDPNFGLAGSNSAVNLSAVSITGGTVGVFVDASGSTGDTVAMQISGNTSISTATTAISVVGANASANIHNNAASIHDNSVGIDVNAGSATIVSNNLFANATGLRFTNGASGTAHFNRIISTTTAIDNPNSLTLNLENNWWGCNAGPGGAGCGAVTGTGADFNPWIVLNTSATPGAIPPFGNSTITADMTHNSDAAVPVGTLPDMAVAWSATNGTMAPPTGTVTAGTASSTFTSTSTSSGTGCAMVDNQQSCANVTVFATTVTIVPAASPTAADNDYTRINNAVQATFNGQTIKLLGTFNWTEPNAAASWALGSNGIGGDLDDYSILVPANINNVTFTADNLGDGTIQGPGDVPTLDLEGVFFFNGGDNQNWTISNIQFLDFDLAIGMFSGAGGVDAFNNTHITNNYIRMARDVATAGDTAQNIAIYYSFGTNQVISGNTIDIQGDAVTVGGNFAADIGMQCDTSGGNVYNNLQITNNTIHVLNAQSANPEVIIGIWENAHGHTSNITVSGNTFTNQGVGNNTATNLQRGFRVTSHSSATSTVTYQSNTVSGANLGFQWIAGSAFAGNLPVVVKSNTITGNGTGVLVQSQGVANLSFNRIVGNTVTGLNNSDGTVTAENNWWGCNAGPGSAGCDAVTGTADFNPWIVLGVSAVPSSIGPGGNSTVTADMTHNSDTADTSGAGTVPLIPVSFTATNGSMAPPTSNITAGQATSVFTASGANSGTACAMVDNQNVCTPITVTSPSFSIDDVTMNEGDAGNTFFIFTVTKTGTTAFNSSVQFQTQDGTATVAGNDYNANSGNLLFSPTDTAAQIVVVVKGDTSIEATENFNVHLFNVSGATISDADGTGTITNDDSTLATISGHINYDDGVTPGKNVTMTLTGTGGFGTQMMTTDANGDYSFTNIPVGNDYTLTPSKTGDVGALHIESIDAAKVARFVAGLDIPTANQAIAADADGDGILTSFDAALIARYVAGLPGSGIVGTWKFVPVNRTYTGLGMDQTAQNFTAILVGDTDGNWMPALMGGGSEEASRAAGLSPEATLAVAVSLPNTNGAIGALVNVPITVGDVTGQGIQAYDLQVTFNPAIVQPCSVALCGAGEKPYEKNGTLSQNKLITPNSNNVGHLIISAFDTDDLVGSGILIYLRFKVVGVSAQTTPLTFENYTDPGSTFHAGCRFNAGTPAATTTNGSLTVNGPTAASGTVSGQITDEQGRPVSGAVVRLNGGQARKTISDANGDYHFENVPAADFYTVTPTRANFGFNPAQRSFSLLGNKTEALFTGVFSGETANPLDTAEYFVRQQYLDVLGREPDEAGFNYWSDQLLGCGNDADCVATRRIDVAAAFFIEREFQVSGAYIYNVYSGGLGRRPGFTEYAVDRQQVVGGAGLAAEQAAFAASFVARAEFVAKYEASVTAEAFVAALLANVQQTAGVDLSSQREQLLARYQTGATQNESRSLVLRGVAENAVFKRAQYNQAFVLTEYFSYLRRDADGPGFEFWLNVLNNQTPGNYRGMVCAFMTAAEYQQRFSTVVSHGNAECARQEQRVASNKRKTVSRRQ